MFNLYKSEKSVLALRLSGELIFVVMISALFMFGCPDEALRALPNQRAGFLKLFRLAPVSQKCASLTHHNTDVSDIGPRNPGVIGFF